MTASSFFAHGEVLWMEGEQPTKSTMHRHPWWYDQVKKDVLSGGDWISNFAKESGEATYEVKAAGGTYTLWVRANPLSAGIEMSVDGGAFTKLDLQKDKRGEQNIAADGKPDLRFIAWSKIGPVPLAAGDHVVTFRFASGNDNQGALDCFVLTTEPFVPQGTRKPGDGTAATPDGWFPLLADDDPFDPASITDMSRLVPAPAGQFGFLQADGKNLRFQKSTTPVKLWGCGANVEPGRHSREELTRRAKYLRKAGINIVRQHAVFDELSAKDGRIDPRKLEEYDWWFAELKKHGIHTDWSVFYQWRIPRSAGYALFDDLEGTGDVRDTYGVITVAPELWQHRNKVLVELLTHRNPHTDLRYVDDPALAIVEMQNEDSVFFWNPLGTLSEPAPKKWPRHAKQLREKFAAWVKKKYADDAALKAAWGDLRHGDSVKAPELRIMGPWELDGPGPRGPFAGSVKRAADCIEFLATLQRDTFADCAKVMRGAGYKGVIMTTAWQVGGAATEAANIWTDSVGDMIDRHNYFGGGAGGHGIAEGKVNNASHLATPGGGIFTVGMKQVESKPFCVTEWTQSPPNQWKAECAPLFAFYGMGLQGWDASFHFAQSGTRLGDGWARMTSYATDTPAYIGQFPALAFAIQRGHVKEAPTVAARRLTEADVFSGRDALKQDATRGGYDAKTLVVDGGTPLEAFAMGRVTVDFAGGKTEQADFSKWWQQDRKTILSATGQLAWDYGRQLVTVRTPKTQAVIGRPGTAPVELPAVTAEIRTPFVSLIFTPLDDAPLEASRHILVTALAQDRQTGARYSADGTMLEAVGTAPLLLEPVQAKITLRGAKPASVLPCDPHGVPQPGKKRAIAPDGSFTLDGTAEAYYYEVRR